ncbi:hypothetical protein CQY22_013275 [Mycolicibacterium brumae]|uniref:DUF2637 domain-containing protein n=2 Tax=Mycolicibacterium brumae TaxID=85968 RepID=A0A2G5P959_9MYCO|nr:hypothetical protein CQY22_013275 [Mycolicibacterium brumae]RWA22707.1 hypothetical protein MBRU_12215 [Mycolicibacterium brumae DSM 44177]
MITEMDTSTEGAEMPNAETAPRYGRGFYVAWFALFTLISMALNGLHAYIAMPRAWDAMNDSIRGWLAVSGAMPTWLAVTAVAVSQIPPVALACATNALVKPDPHTTSGRGTAARSTTWTIAGGAFVLSAIAMTELTHMLLGVPLYVAAIMPIIVDVSIVAAVLRLEIRRRGHAEEAHVPADASPQVGAVEQTDDAPVNRTVTQPPARREASQSTPVERATGRVTTARETPQERSVAHRDANRGASVTRPTAQQNRVVVPDDVEAVAQRIVEQTTITQSVEVIGDVLTRHAAGESQRRIAGATSVSASTVGRIVNAAAEVQYADALGGAEADQDSDQPDPARVLAAVG